MQTRPLSIEIEEWEDVFARVEVAEATLLEILNGYLRREAPYIRCEVAGLKYVDLPDVNWAVGCLVFEENSLPRRAVQWDAIAKVVQELSERYTVTWPSTALH